MPQQHTDLYKSFFGIGALLVFFVLVLPLLRFAPAGAQSQTLTDTGRDYECDIKIQNFFRTLSQGNTNAAFEELLRQSLYNSANANTPLPELRNKVDELKESFGEILRWEKYETKQIGEDIMLIRYILKYERYPVIWSFTFYRKPSPSTAPNSWGVVGLHFDTNIQ